MRLNRFLVLTLSFLPLISAHGQKFGHFSSEYIVTQMPSNLEVEKDIEDLTKAWLEEIKNMYVEIGRMENRLQAEKVLLTKEMIIEREQEISDRMREATEYHTKVFGYNGLFFLKKEELIKPELDKVFEAVKRVCKKQRLDYLLDRSSDLAIIYANPVHDYTDYVLEELGLGDPNDVIE